MFGFLPWQPTSTKSPQQPETKKFNKNATSEMCLLPSPSYSKGRACKAQSQHKHFMKTVFPKAFAILRQLKGQYSRSSCEGFFSKNRCPPHALLHLPNIHHPHLLCPLHHLHLLHHLLYIIIVILIINIYLAYITYTTDKIFPPTSSTRHTYLQHTHYLITDTIIYITTSSTSPTCSISASYITYNIIRIIYNIDKIIYISYISYRSSTSR